MDELLRESACAGRAALCSNLIHGYYATLKADLRENRSETG